MTKKILLIIPILITASVASVFLFNTVKRKKEKKEVVQTIPEFGLPDLYDKNINNSHIDKNKPTLLLFFDPTCDMCIEEFNQINNNAESFEQVQFFFITSASGNSVEDFLKNINFNSSGNMHFLIDSKYDLINKMDVQIIPSIYIYNKEMILIK